MIIKQATTQAEFFALMRVRTIVFVNEQNVDINLEQDDEDLTAIHYVCLKDDVVIATLRILKYQDHVKIGRVAVLKEYRNQKIGSLMIREVEKHPDVINIGKISIHAQVSALPFYEKLGYKDTNVHDYDANILHTTLIKTI